MRSKLKLQGSQGELEINLDEPIKSLGNHKIEINLGYELETKIKIKVQAASE